MTDAALRSAGSHAGKPATLTQRLGPIIDTVKGACHENAIVALILGLFTLTPALAATAKSQTTAKSVMPAPAGVDSDQNGCYIPPVAV